MNDPLILVLVAVLPSVVVFLTAHHLIKRLTDAHRSERQGERMAELRKEDRRQTLPLRLQAYERLTLFLERMQPGALVLRVHQSNMSAGTLHAQLVATIREEFEHNVTQQVYVGDAVWEKVRQVKEEMIRLVNLSFDPIAADRPG
ncbi:MAG: hypothetical protein RBT71_11590, partial [Flavobacteriales bacterium]|nr:hypothetical protein [Flavobacteriales bacterium]